ncbi:MAG: hypothetical protein QHC79_18865 [Pseudosphingobacterium sp.]|nr:hypothetical protein [Pseudosphingobacterium sp.]
MKTMGFHTSDYGINPDKMYIMGSSAGAGTCLAVAYFEPEDITTPVNTAIWGDWEGNSGNPGYSSAISGLVALWGNVTDTLTIKPGDAPLGLMHSIYDPTSPYYSDIDPILGKGYGSYYIHQRAENTGIETQLHTYYYKGHGTGLANPQYLDTTITFSANFFYELEN